jgi:hypothetical protein
LGCADLYDEAEAARTAQGFASGVADGAASVTLLCATVVDAMMAREARAMTSFILKEQRCNDSCIYGTMEKVGVERETEPGHCLI